MKHELPQSMSLGSWDEFLEKDGKDSTGTSPAMEPQIGSCSELHFTWRVKSLLL